MRLPWTAPLWMTPRSLPSDSSKAKVGAPGPKGGPQGSCQAPWLLEGPPLSLAATGPSPIHGRLCGAPKGLGASSQLCPGPRGAAWPPSHVPRAQHHPKG